MPLESKVYSALVATTRITDTVGTRIYPLILPQEPTLPAITYQRITGEKQNHLEGYANLEQVRLQIDIWGTTLTGCKTMSTVVHSVLGAAPDFKALLIYDMDLSEYLEDGTILYRISQDYSIWNRE